MANNRNAYYAALQVRKHNSVSGKDAIILVIIALVFIAVGMGILLIFDKEEGLIAQTTGDGAQKSRATATNLETTTDRTKIPIEIAELPGGEYSGDEYIPILTYHYIRELPGDDDPLGQNLSVSPENFAKQMAYLKSAGYESMTFDDLRAGKIPDKPVIITFDDGYEDAYQNAFPALVENGMTGVFYVITGFVGRDLYLTWNQITEMSEAGMVFGSHTVNHPDLTSPNLSQATITQELSLSKKALEQRLDKTINDFCYPSGKATTTTVDYVYDAGYKTATSTQITVVQEGNYLLWLPRLRIKNDSSLGYMLGQYGL